MLRLLLTTALLVAWTAQYLHVRRKRTEMSPCVAALGLLASGLGIVRWLLAPFALSLMLPVLALFVSQFVMLELITRVRREQRMLPVSLYHRFTLRFKHLRRYFWQWDDFPSYIYFLSLSGAVTLAVMYALSFMPLYGAVRAGMETVSLAAETLMLVPQVMRNRADGNAEILSQVFVAVLLVADTLKVAQYGVAWGADVPWLSAAPLLMGALVQLCIDALLAFQSWAYRRSKHHEY